MTWIEGNGTRWLSRPRRTMNAHSYALSITRPVFDRCVVDLVRDSAGSILLRAGISRLTEKTEFLLANMRNADSRVGLDLPTVLVRTATSMEDLFLPMSAGRYSLRHETAVLCIGIARAAGCFTAICFSSHGRRQLQHVRVVGAGMPLLRFSRPQHEAIPLAEHQKWSRSIGALGDRTWRTLRDLHIAIIGCGRSGSMVAHSLARFGLRRLTLIDGDITEIHNIGEMDLATSADLGSPKAETLKKGLWQDAPHTDVTAVAESAISPKALAAFKRTDLVVSCVDNGVARLTTAILAKLYLRPLLDIGTGILGSSSTRIMGSDIRLVLPNHCLLCFGGLSDAAAARSGFLLAGMRGEGPPTPDWHQQRAGSLRSLNQTAVGIALRMLEDFVGERICESNWIHLTFGVNGEVSLEQRSPTAAPDCQVCRLTGRGDDGIPALHETVGMAQAQ